MTRTSRLKRWIISSRYHAFFFNPKSGTYEARWNRICSLFPRATFLIPHHPSPSSIIMLVNQITSENRIYIYITLDGYFSISTLDLFLVYALAEWKLRISAVLCHPLSKCPRQTFGPWHAWFSSWPRVTICLIPKPQTNIPGTRTVAAVAGDGHEAMVISGWCLDLWLHTHRIHVCHLW